MMLKGNCTKCGNEVKLDIGNRTVEEAIEAFGLEHCPAGNHMELECLYPEHWKLDEWELIEGSAQTEEEFLAELNDKYKEVVDTAEMHKRKIITSFAMGFPMTNDGHNWHFYESPKGKRYYVRS